MRSSCSPTAQSLPCVCPWCARACACACAFMCVFVCAYESVTQSRALLCRQGCSVGRDVEDGKGAIGSLWQ